MRLAVVGLAWFVGTFVPFVLLSVFENRTSYLYYMVIVMPGIYLAVADLIARIGPAPAALTTRGCVRARGGV